jgi:putative phosphoribosyl transferase
MSEEINISIGNLTLKGILSIPEGASGIVIFAHGSGSGRYSPRNQMVAKSFVKHGLATLLLDLLSLDEEAVDNITRELRFDIPFLAKRLVAVTDWVKKDKKTSHLKIAYFGASTGAAAALLAGYEQPDVTAIVSRGGRPDLAKAVLNKIHIPTLLIVGSYDFEVIELNQLAFNLLAGQKKMEIVAGATHLFEEEGTLEEVAKLSLNWFQKHFGD